MRKFESEREGHPLKDGFPAAAGDAFVDDVTSGDRVATIR